MHLCRCIPPPSKTFCRPASAVAVIRVLYQGYCTVGYSIDLFELCADNRVLKPPLNNEKWCGKRTNWEHRLSHHFPLVQGFELHSGWFPYHHPHSIPVDHARGITSLCCKNSFRTYWNPPKLYGHQPESVQFSPTERLLFPATEPCSQRGISIALQ